MMNMSSRQRVKRAIHFQGVDHIPHYLPDGKENDMTWLGMPREPDRQPWTRQARLLAPCAKPSGPLAS
ncbi:MAG: hypothetical protein K9N49_04680 [Candidatus Marinimicrobia bacterium]|nr:hypothetical protein [Candidatus Neomarinimicrobiota bacterium]